MDLMEDLERRLKKAREALDVKVKIAFVGQPGAGKSSLGNALLGRPCFKIGVKNDVTTEPEEVTYGDLYLVDLPGYGTNAFPVAEWLEKFHPEQYDLCLFVYTGKMLEADVQVIEALHRFWKKQGFERPYFVVYSKCDTIYEEGKSAEEIQSEIRQNIKEQLSHEVDEVYFVSCKEKTGIEELKRAILAADITELKKEQIIAYFGATTRADLSEKRKIAQNKLNDYALLASVNAVNPVPGVDIAVDVKLYLEALADIRKIFGIDDRLEATLQKYEILAPIGKRVLDYASKEGVMMLIKQLAPRFAGAKVAKFFPIVGQIAAAAAGYGMMTYVGEGYIDDCYQLAEKVLEGTIAKVRANKA